MKEHSSGGLQSLKRLVFRRIKRGDEEELIERGLRFEDEREAWKVAGLRGADALRASVAAADMVAGIYIGGRLSGVFGVAADSLMRYRGVPWLMAHADFEKKDTAVGILRFSRRAVALWAREYDGLGNLADPEHQKSLAYLRFIGFTLDWDEPVYGPLGHRLLKFHLDAKGPGGQAPPVRSSQKAPVPPLVQEGRKPPAPTPV